ncbi:uncharacterized protein LOC126905501 [Daktulosphaira vitifoliae]|uniref:uncharacterized protein LOC126905501 n=1 Tax=Daktulosphaira vitifoliae TaxID=58002 RepID=UPI0021AAD434|nr:uncharacterized protein LOC126905501 [Daktulosphaira vitifoliae]
MKTVISLSAILVYFLIHVAEVSSKELCGICFNTFDVEKLTSFQCIKCYVCSNCISPEVTKHHFEKCVECSNNKICYRCQKIPNHKVMYISKCCKRRLCLPCYNYLKDCNLSCLHCKCSKERKKTGSKEKCFIEYCHVCNRQTTH